VVVVGMRGSAHPELVWGNTSALGSDVVEMHAPHKKGSGFGDKHH